MKHLPKIELHCHLDGSLRTETVAELAETYGIETGADSLEVLEALLVAPAECDSLLTYLKRFDLPISIMQTKEALHRTAYELMEDAARENVRYIEIRFAPEQHVAGGLTLAEVVESVVEGMKEAENKYPIKGNVILSYLRHSSPEAMYPVIDAGVPFLGNGVVAVDLCAGENEGFAKPFVNQIAYARDKGYRITIHAGETGYASNVVDAVKLLKADRVGHGVAIVNDEEAFKLVQDMDVTIECCPTSNIQTKAIKHMSDHPIDFFCREGLSVTVNTDNRTVSNTTMTDEYELLSDTFEWSDDIYKNIYMASVKASYADEQTKAWLLSQYPA